MRVFLLFLCLISASIEAFAQSSNVYLGTQKLSEDKFLQKYGRTIKDTEIRISQHNKKNVFGRPLSLVTHYSAPIASKKYFNGKYAAINFEAIMKKYSMGQHASKGNEWVEASRRQACANISRVHAAKIAAEVIALAGGGIVALAEPTPGGEMALAAAASATTVGRALNIGVKASRNLKLPREAKRMGLVVRKGPQGQQTIQLPKQLRTRNDLCKTL